MEGGGFYGEWFRAFSEFSIAKTIFTRRGYAAGKWRQR
jgi:hypothetical protein